MSSFGWSASVPYHFPEETLAPQELSVDTNPALTIQFNPDNTKENWPSIVHWNETIQQFIEAENKSPIDVGDETLAYFVSGVGYDPGAYLAFKEAPNAAQTFTGGILVQVLQALEQIERPVLANLSIVLTDDKTQAVGIGCTSGAIEPCQLDDSLSDS